MVFRLLGRCRLGYFKNFNYFLSSDASKISHESFTELHLTVKQIGKNIFRSKGLLKGRQSTYFAYGGQLISQALCAASATVPEDFHPHSLHSYFVKPGEITIPVSYHVEAIRDGRSFYTRIAYCKQKGELVFLAQVSFHKKEDGSINHQIEMPKVVGPENLQTFQELLKGSKITDSFLQSILTFKLNEVTSEFKQIVEVRPVDVDYLLLKEPNINVGHSFHFWMKANEDIGENGNLHKLFACFISDGIMMETCQIPYLSRKYLPSMVFSLDHIIWFHKLHFKPNDWLLCEVTSPFSGEGRAFCTGRLWSREGDLLLSIAQEGIIRAENLNSGS